jgi:tRNA threonylcarbamoyladenosine biosynthesis protein TsaB
MAKKPVEADEFGRLKQCIRSRTLDRLYFFHGEETFLLDHYLNEMRKKTVEEVTQVAVAAGPGSFTGVRIGVAAAKGFAWGRELPCCGVSTLEAMALGAGVWSGYVCPVMDARRAQVYNALFRVEKGVYTRIKEDRAIALSELCQELQQLEGPVFLVGDGSVLTCNTLSETVPNLVLPPEWKQHQRALGVALAAQRQLREGDPCDGASLVPNYLRLSQAERERLERINKEK